MNAWVAVALLIGAPPDGANSEHFGTVDFVYLGPNRPEHIRFRITVDGRSPDAARDSYLSELFTFLDRDGDDKLSGDELALVPAASDLDALLGQTRAGFYTAPGTAAKREELDAERKGRVTLAAFLDYYRRVIPSVRVVPSNSRLKNTEARTEALFRALDADRDGRISKKEANDGEHRLAKFDANEDDLITLEELASTTLPDGKKDMFVLTANAQARKSVADQLTQDLFAHYDRDKNSRLAMAELGLDAAAFKQLDRNSDGDLDANEAAGLAGLAPDAELTVRLGRRTDDKLSLSLTSQKTSRLNAAIRPSLSAGLRVDLHPTRLDVQAALNDEKMSKNARAFLSQQFKAADARSKGYLDATDVARPQFRFFAPMLRLADRNADGRLSDVELAAWFDLQDSGRRNGVTLHISDEGRDLFGLLDANQDGRLDPREQRTVWKRLAATIESVSRGELPRVVQLHVAQGPYEEPPPPTDPLPLAKGPKRVPEWFKKMDRNEDGYVSRKEWLGTPARFAELDLDGDGLIDLKEALAAEK